ncbi:hypothetical protein Slin15195_G130010 [Septoria linicola]|uniref:Uncharacterized protein n=1 Tax=Septoria linicola TaxID=215465 RepID=A0A9Q9B9C5_9PEZI|nr:hypothetical protein Slin14017_G129020 [Septoria linicola]USW59682.1 hypothetical protein Slin15195_G130010 [Septoria linicola]
MPTSSSPPTPVSMALSEPSPPLSPPPPPRCSCGHADFGHCLPPRPPSCHPVYLIDPIYGDFRRVHEAKTHRTHWRDVVRRLGEFKAFVRTTAAAARSRNICNTDDGAHSGPKTAPATNCKRRRDDPDGDSGYDSATDRPKQRARRHDTTCSSPRPPLQSTALDNEGQSSGCKDPSPTWHLHLDLGALVGRLSLQKERRNSKTAKVYVSASQVRPDTMDTVTTKAGCVVLNGDRPHSRELPLEYPYLPQTITDDLTFGFYCYSSDASDGCPSRLNFTTDTCDSDLRAKLRA